MRQDFIEIHDGLIVNIVMITHIARERDYDNHYHYRLFLGSDNVYLTEDDYNELWTLLRPFSIEVK